MKLKEDVEIDDLIHAERIVRKFRFDLVNDKNVTHGDLFRIKELAADIMDQAQGVLRICMNLRGESDLKETRFFIDTPVKIASSDSDWDGKKGKVVNHQDDCVKVRLDGSDEEAWFMDFEVVKDFGESQGNIEAAIDELVEDSSRKLVCVKPGRLEVSIGEARSAEAVEGNIFTIRRENQYYYFGDLDIKGAFLRHDPGLSGRETRPGYFGTRGIEFAVGKEYVSPVATGVNDRDFWAEWKIVEGE